MRRANSRLNLGCRALSLSASTPGIPPPVVLHRGAQSPLPCCPSDATGGAGVYRPEADIAEYRSPPPFASRRWTKKPRERFLGPACHAVFPHFPLHPAPSYRHRRSLALSTRL